VVLESLDAFARLLPGAECATAVCAVVDQRTGVVRYSSAGHVPGVVAHADGTTELLDRARSTPLASLRSPRVEAQVHLRPGSVLALFTDGLIERRGEPLDRGFTRLRDAIAAARPGEPEAVADQLLEVLVPGDDRRDDVALVVCQVTGADDLDLSVEARPDQLRVLRHALSAWLEASGTPQDDANDVLLAVAEAAANAVEHANRGTGRGSAHLSAWFDGATLVIEVRDDGSWLPPTGTDITRGRGLAIMRAVMDDVDVTSTDGGTVVRMSRRLRRGSPT
jgi:anti-sigma regulatory factor (Ser/Thr protein kinase)